MIKKFIFIVLIPILNILFMAWIYTYYQHNLINSWKLLDCPVGGKCLLYDSQLILFGLPLISLVFSLFFGFGKKNSYWLLPFILLPLFYIAYGSYTDYLHDLDMQAKGIYL